MNGNDMTARADTINAQIRRIQNDMENLIDTIELLRDINHDNKQHHLARLEEELVAMRDMHDAILALRKQ